MRPELPEGESLKLFDNVQFIYELALAQLELTALGADFEMLDGFRELRLLQCADIDRLRRRTAYLESVNGAATDYSYIKQQNRKRSVNQYLTHWIYPYKGKFHPQMIRALLNIIGLGPGDTVLDPFVGSGTTAVEAQLLGINCIGVDVSPLCVLQSKVKTESAPALELILKGNERVQKELRLHAFDGGSPTVEEIIASMPEGPVRNFYRMAMLVAISDRDRRGRDFSKSFVRNLEMMTGSVQDVRDVAETLNISLGQTEITEGDARRLPLADSSVDGIVTSPPYSIALDYVKNDAHALSELGRDVAAMKGRFVGLRGRPKSRIELYNEDMRACLDEMRRVLKPGKSAAIVIGNAKYDKTEVETVELIKDHSRSIGFELRNDINKIIFGLYSIMQKEHVLIFEAP